MTMRVHKTGDDRSFNEAGLLFRILTLSHRRDCSVIEIFHIAIPDRRPPVKSKNIFRRYSIHI